MLPYKQHSDMGFKLHRATNDYIKYVIKIRKLTSTLGYAANYEMSTSHFQAISHKILKHN